MVVVKYQKIEEGMFISHASIMRIWNRLLPMFGVPIKNADSSSKKIFFGAATRVGVESKCEYVAFETDYSAREVVTALENNLPSWLKIVEAEDVKDNPDIATQTVAALYRISFDEYKTCKPRINEYLNDEQIIITSLLHGEEKLVDIKNRIYSFALEGDSFVIVAGLGDKSVRIDELVKDLLSKLNKSSNNYSIVKEAVYFMDEEGDLVDIDVLFK